MRTRFYRLCRGELDFLIENCNFSEEDCIIIELAAKQKTDIEISQKLNISTSTVTKRKRKIMQKIQEFLKGVDSMTIVYVNGKRVKKEDLENIEIHSEDVKKILSDKLTKNN